jgi:hypothetical protein
MELYSRNLTLFDVRFIVSIDTPTPISTVCIDAIDATLQAGLPLILAAVICQPHAFVYYVYVAMRLSENVVNHSGLDHWLLNLITLKFLPFRAGVEHHDSHHRFSNYEKNAKVRVVVSLARYCCGDVTDTISLFPLFGCHRTSLKAFGYLTGLSVR